MVVWACLCVGGASENFLLKTRYINSLFDWFLIDFELSPCLRSFHQTSAAIHSKPIFELGLQFGPHYKLANCHVCIPNGCNGILTNEILLTQWNKYEQTKIHATTYMVVHSTRHVSRTTLVCCTHTYTQTGRHAENNIGICHRNW